MAMVDDLMGAAAQNAPRVRRSSAQRLDLALLGVLGFCACAVALGWQPLRGIAVLLAAAIVPGGAIVSRLGAPDPLTAAGLAIALSVAIETLASLALAWLDLWHPDVLGLLLGLGCAALLADNVRRRATGRESR